ncbi:hypothetical protein ACHQM5_019464 [Ranunculus cassubicifolius]
MADNRKRQVKRYWPGKAPDWAQRGEEDEVRVSGNNTENGSDENIGNDDPRLRRLARYMVDDKEEIIADRRRIRQAEIISAIEDEEKQEFDVMEDDEDALEDKRRKIREKMLQKEKEVELEKVESESESEHETDSEEEETLIPMGKLVFVPNSERDTVMERERIEAEEKAAEEYVKRRIEERIDEAKQFVMAEIQNSEKPFEVEAESADIDTDDEVNRKEEDEAWMVRELARIKRDKESREGVNNMTEGELRENVFRRPKRKFNFLQRYYHKGAFFQSAPDDCSGTTVGFESIYDRDFSAPTGEDKLDKAKMAKVMQVKNFGSRGRTKWTHLVTEDTTNVSNL